MKKADRPNPSQANRHTDRCKPPAAVRDPHAAATGDARHQAASAATSAGQLHAPRARPGQQPGSPSHHRLHNRVVQNPRTPPSNPPHLQRIHNLTRQAKRPSHAAVQGAAVAAAVAVRRRRTAIRQLTRRLPLATQNGTSRAASQTSGEAIPDAIRNDATVTANSRHARKKRRPWTLWRQHPPVIRRRNRSPSKRNHHQLKNRKRLPQ
jgi:hypothetical protein